MRVVVLSGLVMTSCRKESKPQALPIASDWAAPATLAGSDVVATAVPTAAALDRIRPAHPVEFARKPGPPNQNEEVIWGTWAATVGDYATRSAFMADRVVLATGSSGDLVQKVTTAIANDRKLATNCVWLELNQDFSGIRRECAVVNGEPSALDQNDPMTGAKKDLGTKLQWYFDFDDKALHIRFADDMVVPAMKDGKLRQLAFRVWTLKLGKKVGENKFEVEERVPEHDYTLPTRYA
jgi:hypothetical protein